MAALLVWGALLSSTNRRAVAEESVLAADTIEYYTTHIQPLLANACFECHSHESGESGGLLLVDSGAAMRAGGTRGAAIVAGDLDGSLLYRALLYDDPDLQMPPSSKLPDEQIELIKAWVLAGAVTPHTEADESVGAMADAQENRLKHWAYQPPESSVGEEEAGRAIDTILSRRLNEKGLGFSPRADRRTLLRRLSYDLTGLTPTFEELEAFASDPGEDSAVFAAAVDGLLASPHFGERWARHWMDIARYSDTKGYVFQEDRQYAQAYRYRDWLIDSLNRDMPYDEFVRKQLAADLEVDAEGNGAEHLPALGFVTLGRRFLNNVHDIIDDRLDVVTRGLMGMTLACARCHDHKYDPVSTADYYALSGVFLNTDEPGGDPFAHRLADSKEPRQSRILIRGNPGRPGDEVQRRFVSFLDSEQTPFGEGSGRGDLARHITDAANPLTARVMVNRVWMNLMGSSLVESPSDIGTRCPPPLQQDLLDQMAIDFRDDQWSIKRMIRRIVLSDAYQQQSVIGANGSVEASRIDPANTLYWRMNRRRRDIESLRDGLLAASGQLDRQLLGPSVKVDQAPFPRRRTVYAYIDRQDLAGFLRNFDMASPDAHSPSRAYTSVPQQGLYLLNSDFVSEQASDLGRQAAQIAAQSGPQTAADWLFRRVLGRQADGREIGLFESFLASPTQASEGMQERWICGHGKLDLEGSKLTSFERLPRFDNNQWSGVDGAPDAKLGWCLLNAKGGHPGAGADFVVVRRWIAPRDGRVRIRGTLDHPAEQGDGVRGTILLGESELLGQWSVHKTKTRTTIEPIDVREGQTIDFVTDSIGGPDHDSFEWTVRVLYEDPPGETFVSEKQFPTPTPQPLDEWQILAQAVLASNEFAFID